MSIDNDIKDANKYHREATMAAMRSTGLTKRIHLWFAWLFSWASDGLQQCKDDDARGKHDTYHDEY